MRKKISKMEKVGGGEVELQQFIVNSCVNYSLLKIYTPLENHILHVLCDS